MILSISFLSNAIFVLVACSVLLTGCAVTNAPVVQDFQNDGKRPRIAVLPVENLSATGVPLLAIRQSYINKLKTGGIWVPDEGVLEKFMARHRLRYTGGLERSTAKAFKEELGIESVLITSLEHYSERIPPKIALTSRLVSTGENPAILWMDAAGLAGDDSPGILELGLIEDPRKLLEKALGSLGQSFLAYLANGKDQVQSKTPPRKFRPKVAYRAASIEPDKTYSVAVVPFFNRSQRKYAGEIMVLHFVRHLKQVENLNVVEPGIVRQQLLSLRMIMDEGISLANADIIFSTLNVDLILTGKVLQYEDYQGSFGKPKVDFSAMVIERKSKKVVWSSSSYNEGDDGVFFFDLGRVNTAHTMASQMIQSIGKIMAK